MTGFIGQDYGVYLEEDFFFPSSRVMAVGGLMLIVYP